MTCAGQSTVCDHESSPVTALREQIFANASILFPQLLKNSITYTKTGVYNPQEFFQVVITSSGSGFKAILVAGVALAKKAVSCGPEAHCVAEALSGLLKVLSDAMGWYSETLLGEVEHAEATENGQINVKMVEEGFHFAHVERWAAKGIGRH